MLRSAFLVKGLGFLSVQNGVMDQLDQVRRGAAAVTQLGATSAEHRRCPKQPSGWRLFDSGSAPAPRSQAKSSISLAGGTRSQTSR